MNNKFFHTPGIWGKNYASGLDTYQAIENVYRDAARFAGGYNTVADWHTHTTRVDQKRDGVPGFRGFSVGDERSFASECRRFGARPATAYVGSADGQLESYDYNTGAYHYTISGYIMQPYDPKTVVYPFL